MAMVQSYLFLKNLDFTILYYYYINNYIALGPSTTVGSEGFVPPSLL